jgi:hypothetical protein
MAPTYGKPPKKRASTRFGQVSKKKRVEKNEAKRTENAERNAIYDIAGEPEPSYNPGPKTKTKVAKTRPELGERSPDESKNKTVQEAATGCTPSPDSDVESDDENWRFLCHAG